MISQLLVHLFVSVRLLLIDSLDEAIDTSRSLNDSMSSHCIHLLDISILYSSNGQFYLIVYTHYIYDDNFAIIELVLQNRRDEMSILPLLIKRAAVDGYLTDLELEEYMAQFDADGDLAYAEELDRQYEEYLKEIENRSDADVI